MITHFALNFNVRWISNVINCLTMNLNLSRIRKDWNLEKFEYSIFKTSESLRIFTQQIFNPRSSECFVTQLDHRKDYHENE